MGARTNPCRGVLEPSGYLVDYRHGEEGRCASYWEYEEFLAGFLEGTGDG